MDKNRLLQTLIDYFGINDECGTYYYNLTRSKKAFALGTMSFDDFKELEIEDMEELADYIIKKFWKPLQGTGISTGHYADVPTLAVAT